jgi:hypothetical protein
LLIAADNTTTNASSPRIRPRNRIGVPIMAFTSAGLEATPMATTPVIIRAAVIHP